MSTSTDAILLYGLEIPEDIMGPGIETGALYDFYEKHYNKEEYGVNLICHCCDDYPMYMAAISESVITSSRGYPEAVHNLKKKPDWDEKLLEFAKKYKLRDKTPQWWLCSWWG